MVAGRRNGWCGGFKSCVVEVGEVGVGENGRKGGGLREEVVGGGWIGERGFYFFFVLF